MRVIRSVGACLLITLTCTHQAVGQASVNVSTLDLVYRDLEKLKSFGLVDPGIVGQRPYTRLDFARFAQQARGRLDATRSDYVRDLVERLERRFGSELETLTAFRAVDQLHLELTGARSPPRLVRANIGSADAAINPLLGYRQGRKLVDGLTASVETVHWARLSRRLVVYAHPRLQLSEVRGSAANVNDIAVQEAYGKLVLGNVAIQAGRANMVWGQGRHAGLMLSENARGFDMVKLSNAEPRVLPGIFRFLGSFKASLFFATTAADRSRHFLNSYILGYKVSVRPVEWLEIGGSFVVEAGGEGAPEASLGKRITDHIFLVDLFVNDADVFFSNKIGGFDIRVNIPGLRGLQLYGEAVFDDITPSDIRKWLIQDSGYLAGIYVPRVDRTGRFDFSFEYQYSGVRLYRHSQFLTGLTFDRLFWGNILGPEGRAGYVELNWDATYSNTLSLNAAYEGRSNDAYVSIGPDRTRKVRSLPQERRYRVVGSWTHRPLRQSFLIRMLAGYERVNTFDFELGSNHGGAIAQVEFSVHF